MDGLTTALRGDSATRTQRICAHPCCNLPVKKSTAKYCSVRCCGSDPARHARLRTQARKSNRKVVPLSLQMTLGICMANDDEALLARLCAGREDAPAGMSRLAG